MRKKTGQPWARAMGLALICGNAAGCGQPDGTKIAETDESIGATQQAVYLFKDPVSTGPRLDVYDFDGHAAMAISGPIESLRDLMNVGATLREAYLRVHPTTNEVPLELLRLEDQFAADIAALKSQPDRSTDLEIANIDKSESAFMAQACQHVFEGSIRYSPIECHYQANVSRLLFVGDRFDPGDGFRMRSGARTYGWNATSTAAEMGWQGPDTRIVAIITLPPFWFTYLTVSGVTGGHRGFIFRNNPGVVIGDQGLSWHAAFPI
jgi:hypothetical protein